MGQKTVTARRVFFYVQHLLGIGHLVRTNRIAEALRDHGFDVTVAMGGMPVAGFPGQGITVVPLPAVRAAGGGFATLEDAAGRPVDNAFKAARRETLLAALSECRPDVLIVETFPFGRRVMRFELLPLLEAARAMGPKPLIACSVRDILQERGKPGRAEEAVDTIERYFDLVTVHGDPNFASFGETFPLADALTKKISHTGLVAGPLPPLPSQRFDIVISAGGGAAGLALVNSALQMAKRLGGKRRCCLITGPNLPGAESDALNSEAIPGLEAFSFRPDFPSLLRGAQLSISQAGYNTVCDILQAGCRSLLIPFAAGGETEQTARAIRLKRLGLADVLPEEGLDAAGLTCAVERALAGPPPPPHGLDLDGARRTADILRHQLLA
jgi:predicted glycosyltransferase